MRVLVVEDEMLIAMLVEDMLDALGHKVVGIAGRLPQAIILAETAELDFAVLDVNLNGQKSFPVADVLARRGVGYVFATGYGLAGLDAPYDAQRVIKKPFALEELAAALKEVRAAGA